MVSPELFALYTRALEEEPRLRGVAAWVNRLCQADVEWTDEHLTDVWCDLKHRVYELVGWGRQEPEEWIGSQEAWHAVTHALYERLEWHAAKRPRPAAL